MDLKIPKALSNRVFNNGYKQAFSRYDLGDKVEENDKRTCLEKKFFLKRIRIRQEMDLKIPKALSNRVFNNGYSKQAFSKNMFGKKIFSHDLGDKAS